MKIVLDTNVLITAFITRGSCNELLEYCAVHHAIVLSKGILDEFRDVLVRTFGFTREEARAAVRVLRSRARIVTPLPLPQPVCRDPDDDLILATAVAGRCAAIITGDKDLTDLNEYEGIRILNPPDFWRLEKEIAGQNPRDDD
ncbi:MAG: putative toxin-antitoxin system toxin component, PIN family [Chlamydiota bacterium]